MCNLCSRYLGQEVIWHDQFGNSIGPGTVTDILVRPGNTVLSVLGHSTGCYYQLHLAYAQVERIELSEDEIAALPRIILDEIRYALESGLECSVTGPDGHYCQAPRLFGSNVCAEHAMGEDENPWWKDEFDYMDGYM